MERSNVQTGNVEDKKNLRIIANMDAREESRYQTRRSDRREDYPFARWIHRITITLIVIAAIVAVALWIMMRMVSG